MFFFNIQRCSETLCSVHRSLIQQSGHCLESPDWGKPSPRQECEQTIREGANPCGWCRVTGDSTSSRDYCRSRNTVIALNNLTSDWSGSRRMRNSPGKPGCKHAAVIRTRCWKHHCYKPVQFGVWPQLLTMCHIGVLPPAGPSLGVCPELWNSIYCGLNCATQIP